jgi:hypothetical protein
MLKVYKKFTKNSIKIRFESIQITLLHAENQTQLMFDYPNYVIEQEMRRGDGKLARAIDKTTPIYWSDIQAEHIDVAEAIRNQPIIYMTHTARLRYFNALISIFNI